LRIAKAGFNPERSEGQQKASGKRHD
jgi:hypothetical protein